MSSRALRKLQREQEEKRQAAKLEQNEDLESEEEATVPSKPKALNAFDMLNAAEEDAAGESDVDQDENEKSEKDGTYSAPKIKPKKTKKKKKVKGKQKAAEQNSYMGQPEHEEDEDELDEIDRALKSLSAKDKQQPSVPTGPTIDEANAQLYRLLAVEAKHLNALNEMKRLFGSVVLESNGDDASTRRRGRGPQTVDLGGALSARHSPVSKGQGLKGLALKRNPLMMGKEEWPSSTSGGLGMELVEKMEDGTTEYRFVHSSIYQGVQREFESCVASMDPQRLINMLVFNPYHISTLLQVSEIAKQQGDHSVASDLLERTLFTFGRSVHSTFTHALSEGKARLDFRRPENREFWLAAWRYVKDLGQRGTWRTAYEWAKLILSLDPEGDPYCISKVIDQLALRGGQSNHFLGLADLPFFKDDLWASLPNIKISKSMAHLRLKQPQACRSTLAQAVEQYPWVIASLFQELNLSNLPRSIWGKQPRTDRETFDTEFYVLNAKDFWSPPEAVSLLVEVAETTAPAVELKSRDERPITLDEARVTILSNNPALINLLPRDLTTRSSNSSDPLPPEDDLPSYDPSLPTSNPTADAALEAAYADMPSDESPDHEPDSAAPQGPSTLTSWMSRMIPWLTRAGEGEPDAAAAAAIAAQEAGVSPTDVAAQHDRFLELRQRLAELPDERPLGAERVDPEEVAAEEQRLRQIVNQLGQADGQQIHIHDSEAIEDAAPLPADSDEEREVRLGIPPAVDSPTSSVDAASTIAQTARRSRPSSPPSAPAPAPQHPSSSSSPPSEEDQQSHLQHYLAGTGITLLKTYLQAHTSNDPNADPNFTKPEGSKLIETYAGKLQQLKNRRTRDFILRYALPQGTSRRVGELIEECMGRMGG